MYMFGERKGNMINPLTKGICLCNLTPDTPLEIQWGSQILVPSKSYPVCVLDIHGVFLYTDYK